MPEPVHSPATTRRVIKPKDGVDQDTAAHFCRPRPAKAPDPLLPHPSAPHPRAAAAAPGDPPTSATVRHAKPPAAKTAHPIKGPPPTSPLVRIFGTFNPDRVWTTVWWIVALALIASFIYIFWF